MNLDCFSSAAGCRGFGLGLAAGLALATAAIWVSERPGAGDGIGGAEPASDALNRPAWHHATTRGDLATAMQMSLGVDASPSGAALPAMQTGPGAAGGDLLSRAAEYRRRREFRQACDLYAQAAEQGVLTADAWADYADAQASLAGRLAGAPERAIDAALRLDADHPKALWLKASLAHEQRRYGDALETWRRLLAVVPAGSTDARIIEANIAEASRLAAG